MAAERMAQLRYYFRVADRDILSSVEKGFLAARGYIQKSRPCVCRYATPKIWTGSASGRVIRARRPKDSSPQFGLDVSKNGIALFQCFQNVHGVAVNLTGALEALPSLVQVTELLKVSIKAHFGVVASRGGGDQELPVRGFKQ